MVMYFGQTEIFSMIQDLIKFKNRQKYLLMYNVENNSIM